MVESFSTYDKDLIFEGLSPKEINESLTMEDVENFLRSLGVDDIEKTSKFLVCPTICHNPLSEATSMKLYWYEKNKMFHCYTECGENMTIFDLYQRYMEINYHKVSFEEAKEYVQKFLKQVIIEPTKPQENLKDKYDFDCNIQTLDEYSPKVLDYFTNYHHPLWIKEGITEDVMDKFDIKFSIGQNKIIIPHYDLNGRLVGIRGRALDKRDIEGGKYKPILIGNTLYAHQLHYNLYGLYQHKEAIKRYRRAIIFEGEKSVLKDDVFYGKDSVAVACCGSKVNKYQINLLVKEFQVNEIVIAFDKEYDDSKSDEAKKYKENLYSICQKYSHLASMSFIYDYKNLLDKKDSPIDKGKEIYERLYLDRTKVRW